MTTKEEKIWCSFFKCGSTKKKKRNIRESSEDNFLSSTKINEITPLQKDEEHPNTQIINYSSPTNAEFIGQGIAKTGTNQIDYQSNQVNSNNEDKAHSEEVMKTQENIFHHLPSQSDKIQTSIEFNND